MQKPSRKCRSWFKLCFYGMPMLLLCSPLAYATGPAQIPAPWKSLLTYLSQRNALADQVALTKWDNHTPVLAAAREDQELQSVRSEAPSYNLDPDDAAAFFSAQLESNKEIQYQLLQRWHLIGQAPNAPRPDLTELRTKLDQLQGPILEALAASAASRANPACADELAQALLDYAKHQHLDRLHYHALVRSFGDFCHLPE